MSSDMSDRTTGRAGPNGSGEADPGVTPKRPEMSLGELFSEMTSELSTLFRKEVELAKVEGREEIKQAGAAAGMFAGAGLGAWMAILFASFALAWLLDQAMNTALAFLLVAVLWGIVALILLSIAKKKAKSVQALPQTTRTLKEDVQWAKAQKS
jgi:F0F1-type ATP synthase assembly protein I